MPDQISARWTGFLFLGITATGWAANWVAIKILLREWPPLFSRGVSGVAAAILMAGVALAFRESLKVPRHAVVPLLFAAFTNVFAWMGFGTMSMKYLAVSEGTLLIYTMPIWATLFAWPVLGKRPALRDVVALLLGVSGLVVLKQPLPVAPTALVAWQVGLGCLPMIFLRLLFEQPDLGAISGSGLSVLVYMVLGPMGACYLAWFAALRRLPAATAAIGTLSVPIIGVTTAALVLGEPFGTREVLAMALTLAGVALVMLKPRPAVARAE